MYPENLKYTEEHEWLRIEGENAFVGITFHAQQSLGDVVFVELPEVGKKLKTGEVMGVVESVKAVSDIYSPCSGTVIAVNEALLTSPELLNNEPYGDGWMVQVKVESVSDNLMTAAEYEGKLSEEG